MKVAGQAGKDDFCLNSFLPNRATGFESVCTYIPQGVVKRKKDAAKSLGQPFIWHSLIFSVFFFPSARGTIRNGGVTN